ncbi:MAG: flagellar hook-basal body complex protein [Nitrospina sp.]|jgi:flagellar basal-body rod protein FlgG|nr:flagellar hook-basal body complex protein [Nitrospina sp.]
MLGPTFSALSGLNNASKRLQNSANNLANVQTSGFKKSDVNSVESKTGGTRVNSISKVNTQGGLIPTNNPLDLAINGNGFFQVANPNGGTSFTRSGSFNLNGAGQVVDSSGNALIPEINVPAGNNGISVGSNGQVSAQTPAGLEVAGQIQLANFNNPSGLSAAGGNLLNESAASGAPVAGNPGEGALGSVLSGFLEGSNVDIAEEMVDQIIAKAAFKANINVIKANDEMIGSLLDIKS